MINTFTGQARLTKDAELKEFSKVTVTNLQLVTSISEKKDDEWVEHPLFFRGVTFGALAKKVAEFKKGEVINFSGRLVNKRYKNSSGEERDSIECQMYNIERPIENKSSKKSEPNDLPEADEDFNIDL